MNSNLNNGVSMFTLQNSRGEVVDLDSDDLFGYTPTGLGTVFSNSYSQYESYFKPTKKTIQQGQMSLYILFGSVESNSYQTFSDFASFLAYEPLTLIYTTKSGSWYRDAVLSSLTKTEIGGTTVIQVDRLVEQFAIDFINPWYNNKTADYKSYDADPNLAIYGKGYFNEISNYETNSNGQRNKIKNSGFVSNFKYWYYTTNEKNDYSGLSAIPSDEIFPINTSAHIQAKGTGVMLSNLISVESNKTFSIRLDYLNTISGSGYYSISGYDENYKYITEIKAYKITGSVSNSYATRKDEKISIPSTVKYISFRIKWYGTTDLYIKKPMLTFDDSIGDYVNGIIDVESTWNYGYFTAKAGTVKNNQAYADMAKTDITYIEN